MIYTTCLINENNDNEELSLKNLLNTEYYNIIFGDAESVMESVEAFNKDATVSVLIRNRKRDGRSGKPIQHPECTVKLIKNTYPKHEGQKGIPFTIDPIDFHKKANNPLNKKAVSKSDMRFLKAVIKDQYDNIVKYWEADPDTPEGMQTIINIENEIRNEYTNNKKKGK